MPCVTEHARSVGQPADADYRPAEHLGFRPHPAAYESPVYPILQLDKELTSKPLPEGYKLETYTAQQPADSDRLAMKWDGEWHITYEMLRDLGLAFAAVLVLIYILVVAWFQSFKTPLVIMAAIPFSLVGILPGHWAMGAFFTATSMIGFIAGAGIVVRNSIILVDFIELRLSMGEPLDNAVVDAVAVRFRPMMLTAATVVVGSAVILFDPIFQGLAISLMAGEVASLLLSRMTVPVLFFMMRRCELQRRLTRIPATDQPGGLAWNDTPFHRKVSWYRQIWVLPRSYHQDAKSAKNHQEI